MQTLAEASDMLTDMGVGGGGEEVMAEKEKWGSGLGEEEPKGKGRNWKNKRNRGMGEVGASRGTWCRYGAWVRYMGSDQGKKVDQG